MEWYKEFMQLVGYSNTAQKILESNAILWWKIFGEKHRSREMHKEGDLCLPCCCERSRDSSKNFGCTSTARSTQAQTTPEETT